MNSTVPGRPADPKCQEMRAPTGALLWAATARREETSAWRASGAARPASGFDEHLVWCFDQDGGERGYLSRPLELATAGQLMLLLEFCVSGWQSCALAVGWQDDEGHFWRLRLRHVRENEWQTVRLRDGSLEFAIDNEWKRPERSTISGIRLVAVGEPGSSATLELRRAEIRSLQAEDVAPRVTVDSRQLPLGDPGEWGPALAPRPRDEVLHQYLLTEDLVEDGDGPIGRARDLRERGIYRLESAKPVTATVRWRDRAGASRENAWRFRWHALESCRILLSAFHATAEDEYLYMAREHAGHWLEENFHRQTGDRRYAWYDHATALRTISLLAIWDLGQERGFDVMTLAGLLEALHAHGELLASETFLARNQPYREHNHALFQAVALLFVGQVAPFRESPSWTALGAERCRQLMSALVSEEGVCVENSIAYHTGLTSLAGKLYEVFTGYGLDGADEFYGIRNAMQEFGTVFSYPNGTSSAIGDSWHFCEDAALTKLDRLESIEDERDPRQDRFYPSSGYAVLRKCDPDGRSRRQLNLVCSALNVTHKHADQLSITFWSDGIEWLADPGLYKYGAEDLHAEHFRHARAHNALVLDDETYLPAAGNATLVDGSGSATSASLIAEHRGYGDAIVRRHVEYDKSADRVTMVDEVEGDAEVGCALWFHAGLGVQATAGEHGEVLLTYPRSESALLVVPRGNYVNLEVFYGQEEPFAAGWIYTAPGRAVATASWRYACSLDDLPFTTVLLPGKRARLTDERERIVADVLSQRR